MFEFIRYVVFDENCEELLDIFYEGDGSSVGYPFFRNLGNSEFLWGSWCEVMDEVLFNNTLPHSFLLLWESVLDILA